MCSLYISIYIPNCFFASNIACTVLNTEVAGVCLDTIKNGQILGRFSTSNHQFIDLIGSGSNTWHGHHHSIDILRFNQRFVSGYGTPTIENLPSSLVLVDS